MNECGGMLFFFFLGLALLECLTAIGYACAEYICTKAEELRDKHKKGE